MFNTFYSTGTRAKNRQLTKELERCMQSGKAGWLLVPEQFSLSAERLIISAFGVSAQTQIKVITFSRLCNMVLSRLGPLRLKYIDGAGKQIVASRTIRQSLNATRSLTQALGRRGFSAKLVDLMSELKRYGVTPQMLTDASENSDGDFGAKLADIALLLENYTQLIEEQASDAEDNLSLILPKIKNCGFLAGELFIMHFRSFTPVELEAIGQLMTLADTTAFITIDDMDKPSAVFMPNLNAYNRLKEKAESLNVAVTEPVLLQDGDANPEIAYLEQNYFAPRPKPCQGAPDSIKVLAPSGIYRETEAAADLIIRLCREENRKFSDFLILARDTSRYNRLIPSVFASRGIEVFLDTSRSVLTKPFAEFICSALDICAYGYSYDRVMAMARTGMLNIEDKDIDIFENYLLAVAPSYAMWGQEQWSYELKGYDLEKINQTRTAVCGFAEYLIKSISGRKSADQICGAITDGLKKFELDVRVQEICDSFTEQGMSYLADEYRQVWNSVISVLMQISALMDKEGITWQDFGDLFKNACSGISVGVTPQTQGSVVFSQIDRFRSEDTPVVIVLGMNEGVFPRAHVTEGLISDAERNRLYDMGIQLAPTLDAKRAEEQLLIHSVLTSASERLYLSRPASDSQGTKLEPSPIIKRIKERIFPDIELDTLQREDDPLGGAEGRQSAFEALCSMLADAEGDFNKLCPAGKALAEFFENDAEYRAELEEIQKIITAPKEERLSRDSVRAIYGDTLMLSASKLEKYNACAFAYFLQYGLHASERDKAGVEPRSTGSIQHDALYTYFTELNRENKAYSAITQEQCYDRVYELVKEIAMENSQLLYESSAYYKYIVTRMQGISARTAWEAVKFYKSSDFRPIGYELKIDLRGDIPCLSIRDGENKEFARLSGIIDRADKAVVDGKTYISIVDYKSSRTLLDKTLTENGIKLQPLMYTDMLCRKLEASPGAMLYMQMTDPIVSREKLKTGEQWEIEKEVNKNISYDGWINDSAEVVSAYSRGGDNGERFIPSGKDAFVSAEELSQRIRSANEKIQQSAKGIYDGNITAEPFSGAGFDACQYCPYGVCCDK